MILIRLVIFEHLNERNGRIAEPSLTKKKVIVGMADVVGAP